ncbi:MAG: sugar transferase, partial [Melioribacteraceae bacterium]|nr:sugar transferase [Melioribacteraceae bacterium]
MNKRLEKVIIITTDFLTINLAWIVYFFFRVETGWFELITRPEFFLPMFAVYFYWLVIFSFVGMYRTWFASSRFDELSTLFKASFVGIFLLFAVIFYDDLAHNAPSGNRLLIFIYWGIFLTFVS